MEDLHTSTPLLRTELTSSEFPSSSTDSPDAGREKLTSGVVAGIATMCGINVLALCVNLAVFVVIVKTPHLRGQLTYFFVLNLCFVDMLNAVIALPLGTASFAFGSWVFGDVFCQIFGFLSTWLMCVSILSVSVISVERYYSIRLPMHYAAHMTVARTVIILVYIWTQSFCIAISPIIGWNSYEFREYRYLCTYSWREPGKHRIFVIFNGIMTFALPTAVMTTMYAAIFCVAKKAVNQVHPSQVSCSHQAERQESALDTAGISPRPQRESQVEIIRYDVHENPRDGISTISRAVQIPSITVSSKPTNGNMSNSCMVNLNIITPVPDQAVRINGVGTRRPSGGEVPPAAPGTLATPRRPGGHWKAVKTLLVIMTFFLVSWAPMFVLHMHGAVKGSIPNEAETEIVITWLAFASHAINPFIYGWLNRSVRDALGILIDQMKVYFFAPTGSEPELTGAEDFLQFLERTSTTRTLSVPQSKSSAQRRSPPVAEEMHNLS